MQVWWAYTVFKNETKSRCRDSEWVSLPRGVREISLSGTSLLKNTRQATRCIHVFLNVTSFEWLNILMCSWSQDVSFPLQRRRVRSTNAGRDFFHDASSIRILGCFWLWMVSMMSQSWCSSWIDPVGSRLTACQTSRIEGLEKSKIKEFFYD